MVRAAFRAQQDLVTFEDSGHTPHLHEPGRFATYLSDVVLPQTYPPVAVVS